MASMALLPENAAGGSRRPRADQSRQGRISGFLMLGGLTQLALVVKLKAISQRLLDRCLPILLGVLLGDEATGPCVAIATSSDLLRLRIVLSHRFPTPSAPCRVIALDSKMIGKPDDVFRTPPCRTTRRGCPRGGIACDQRYPEETPMHRAYRPFRQRSARGCLNPPSP